MTGTKKKVQISEENGLVHLEKHLSFNMRRAPHKQLDIRQHFLQKLPEKLENTMQKLTTTCSSDILCS